jgi:RND family efflux transporter MFP subunit
MQIFSFFHISSFLLLKAVPKIFIVGVLLLVSCSPKSHADEKLGFLEAIPVKVVDIQVCMQTGKISATGLLATRNEAKYGFKIGGIIEHISVREGEFFKKGALLARLRLTEIEAGVEQARVAFEKAQRDYRRTMRLYQDSVATLEQMQNTKSALDLAERQLQAVEFNKQFASIYAQSDGFVTKKIANEGEVIAGGSPVLATNNPHSDGWVVRVGVTDKDWASIMLNDSAYVVVDAFPSQVFAGTVVQKAQAADPQSGSFQIEIRLSDRNDFALGMYAKAMIATRTVHTSMAIPYSALIEAAGNRAFVFVPVEHNKVKKVAITIGSFDNESVYVVSGLENVQSVIVSNSAFLNEQSAITIVK